jgi:hypothetical protein
MMKRLSGCFYAKLFALLLIGCLLFFTAIAEGEPSLYPMLDEWIARIKSGEAAVITLSATLHDLVPYGEETTAAMNRLLSECKVRLGYQQSSEQGETTRTQFIIGQTPAVDFTMRSGEQMLAQTSLLPGTTLQSGSGSPLELLLGEETEIPFWAADILDPNELAGKIPDALNELSAFAQVKTGSYHLSSIGTAKKAVIYTVPESGVLLLRDSLCVLTDELNWTQASALMKTLTMSGSAVITLYQTSDGNNIGLGVKATMGFENIAPRKVTFLWVFKSSEKSCQHSLSLKAPSEKGSDNLTVTGEMTLECLKDKNRLSLGMDIKSRLNSKSDRTQWTGQLDCLMAEDNQRLEGDIKRTYTDPTEVDHILCIKPSLLTVKAGGEVSVKGSARLKWEEDKSTVSDVTLSLLADKTADIPWEETGNTVSLDGLSGTELEAMSVKAQTAAAEAIWRAVMSLPEECLALITQNISQEDWARIYQDAFKVVQ